MRSLLLLLLGLATLAAGASYEGHQVVRVVADTPEELRWVLRQVEALELDQWTHPRSPGRPLDVVLPPALVNGFLGSLHHRRVNATVTIPDLQSLIDEQAAHRQHRVSASTAGFDHTTYHTLEEINAALDQAANNFPSLMSTYNAGTTYEGRPIRVIQVSTDDGDSKPVIWIDCGIHAREWVSSATCQYILDRLTADYGNDRTVTDLLDTYDFHVVTNVNPDGYEYTWTDNRLWRKNRYPFGGSLDCYGVDPNRNFDSNFGGPGTSDNPCASTYHGPSAFSEAESQAVRDSVERLGGRVSMFFTLHAYSQYWMTPYGYTYDLPANYDEQYRVAEVGVQALTAVYGTQFMYGNIADVIYLASGGSTDWAYDSLSIPYTYALELRDTGTYGFLLPEEQILPTAEETWAGIMAAIAAAK